MKLPKSTAENAFMTLLGDYRFLLLRSNISESIGREGFDLGSLISCGASVLPCLYCGVNPVCWLACAGPGVVQCVRNIIKG
jgi:hypothetical protein